MQLTQHRNHGELFVRKADGTCVVVVDRSYTRSFVLFADHAVEDFPVREVSQLDNTSIESILASQPEVVLLGTGTQTVFPAPSILAQFLKRGVGLEAMDNAAAARTFNVLAGELRRVCAVFLLPG